MKNIILITIDCLRADHLSCYGHNRKTTPNIDKLAGRGILFSQAIANSCNTQHSFPSILTSSYSFMDNSMTLSNQRTTIGEVLKKVGYSTAAFHSNPFLSKEFNYDRGFDTFYDFNKPSKTKNPFRTKLIDFGSRLTSALNENDVLYKFLKRLVVFYNRYFKKPGIPHARAEEINKKALSWLEKCSGPFFLWVHYMDAHYPYTPLSKVFGPPISKQEMLKFNKKLKHNFSLNKLSKEELNTAIDLYDSEIKYIDNRIGILLNKLKKMNKLKNTHIIVTADHGEAFAEHKELFHGEKLYDELLHVPLIISSPGFKAKRISQQVSLLDLAPTILGILGLPKPENFLGNSLCPLIKGKKMKLPAVISEEGYKKGLLYKPSLGKKISYRTEEWKYIYNENARDELYNLKKDSKELKNLVNKEKMIAKKLKSKILKHISMEKEQKIYTEKGEIQKRIEVLKVIGKI